MAKQRRYFAPPKSRRTDTLLICAVGLVFSLVTVYYFTIRTYSEEQQRKARLLLEQIYRLQRAHFEQYRTYVPIDRDRNADVLRLDDAFPYAYRVEVPDSTSFIATAWADLKGDGKKDIWTVDQSHPTPIHKEKD